MLDSLKSSKKAVGIKQSIKAVESDLVKLVFIAQDSDERVTKTFKEMCLNKSIEIVNVENMKLLGKACGIEVGAAVACILK